MPKPENLLMSYIVCDMLSKSDQTVAHDAWVEIIEEISDRFKAMLPPQIAGENPQVQQLQQQLQQTQQQAQQIIQQLQQQIQELNNKSQIDVAKVHVDEYNAETNRVKAMSTGMTPEQVQMIVMQTMRDIMTQGSIQ